MDLQVLRIVRDYKKADKSIVELANSGVGTEWTEIYTLRLNAYANEQPAREGLAMDSVWAILIGRHNPGPLCRNSGIEDVFHRTIFINSTCLFNLIP